MTHDEVGALAAERYFLHEMPDDEREAFEEHYFDCVVCANEVQSVYALHDSVRASALCEPAEVVVHPAARWRMYVAPLAAAASLAIGVVAMQVAVVAPTQTQLATARRPFVPAEYKLEDLRGANRETVNSREPNELKVDIPTDIGPAPYTCSIVDAHGQPLAGPFTVTAERAANYFPIDVPAGALKPGEYKVRVSDANQKIIREYPVTIR